MASLNVQPRTLAVMDNLPFLRSINNECVDLIAIDPPFAANETFTGKPKPPITPAEFAEEAALAARKRGEQGGRRAAVGRLGRANGAPRPGKSPPNRNGPSYAKDSSGRGQLRSGGWVSIPLLRPAIINAASCGGMAERTNAAVLKTAAPARRRRGFESHSLRQNCGVCPGRASGDKGGG